MGDKNTTTRRTKHLRKSWPIWPIHVSTRQFSKALQLHRLLNGILPLKPTGQHYGRFRENWKTDARTQGAWRSGRTITWPDWHEMFRALPHSQPIGLVQSAYVTCLLRGDSTKLVQHQHRILYERQNAAASLGMHMYGFRVILKDTFAPGDLDTVRNLTPLDASTYASQRLRNKQLKPQV